MGFVVFKVALARVLHRVLQLCRLSMIPPMIHAEISTEWTVVPLDATVSRRRWMVDVLVAVVKTASLRPARPFMRSGQLRQNLACVRTACCSKRRMKNE
jgi:hypothetical protein